REGNAGSVTVDHQVKYAGNAAAHLFKAEGPGGVQLSTRNAIAVTPGLRYRVNCQLRTANSTGAQAYWMVSATDETGSPMPGANLFGRFVKGNQDFQPLPFEFVAPPGAVAIRLHFLVSLPGELEAWVDDVSFEQVQ
ncbi:MAG: hypothetical protein WCP21_23460, partial [Armatimonadota bacterium]